MRERVERVEAWEAGGLCVDAALLNLALSAVAWLKFKTKTCNLPGLVLHRGAGGPRGAGAAGPSPPCAAGHYQGVASGPAAAPNDTCHLN